MNNLPYFHGEPVSTGDLRTHMADFKVFELLPFQASGDGEHLVLHIRKTGLNTIFVASQLAKFFSVKESMVSYAGLKDRFAVCEQYFSVHLPGKNIDDISNMAIDGVEVLSMQRHNKKLRTGALLGNRFELTLRNVTDIDELSKRWQVISTLGVPNYFGEQRFGIDAGNLDKASALFNGGKVKDKKKRGLYLSAARSHLFNMIVAKRITDKAFEQLQVGDVCMLAGTQSVFPVDEVDEVLVKRLAEFDVDITAPMWGSGRLMTSHSVEIFELSALAEFKTFTEGLEKFGLKQERRKIRLTVQMPKISLDNNTVVLSFCLPSGCYATTILRELIQYQDLTQRVDHNHRESVN